MTARSLAGWIGVLLVLGTTDAGASPRHDRLATPSGVWVVDGDTFRLGPERIRLRGIDTPERGEPGSAAARRRLQQLLRAGPPVTIVRRGQDVYGRTLADVYVGGWNVAAILCREGFAKPPPHGCSP